MDNGFNYDDVSHYTLEEDDEHSQLTSLKEEELESLESSACPARKKRPIDSA